MACIRTHLISCASAVSLVPRPEDRTRLLSSSLRSFPVLRRFSVPECWAGAGNRRVLSLCCFWSAASTAQSAVTFDSTFLFEAPPLLAWVTSRTRLCHIERPPKLHFENFNINYLLDLLCMLWEHGCEKYTECIFKFFTTRLSLFNEYEIYGTTYEYIYIYIHTDTASVQHVNVGLAQARPNNIR